MTPIDRRSAVGMIAGAVAATPTLVAAAPAAISDGLAFLHGVASGDPLADRVILWTRVTPQQGATPAAITVTWQVATDTRFRRIVREGRSTTGPSQDYTVKIDATGLRPDTPYFYRFRAGDRASPTGRTRTLPAGKDTRDMVLAVASCSFYATGFFNAYREIAALERVDLVLHLGDYIYDYGAAPDELGMSVGIEIGRIPSPANETITLADYRGRYACYRADPDLQAAHARAPWICIWDDHESANDAWMGGAQNHQSDEGDWAARRTASVRAYYEWIPIRDPEAGRAFEAINRRFELGDLATLIMLESRLQARTRQLSLGQDMPWNVLDLSDPEAPKTVTDAATQAQMLKLARSGQPLPKPYAVRADVAALETKLADPARQMLGTAQEEWLRGHLTASVAAGKPWQVIGNQVVMARTTAPDVLGAMGATRWDAARAQLPPPIRGAVEAVVHMGKGLPYGLDGWNGYPAARTRMDGILADTSAHPLILSGDSHAFWVNELAGAPGKGIAAEIGTTAISSSSLGDLLGGFDIGAQIAADNEEVLYSNQIAKGFALVTLARTEAQIDLIAVSTVLSRDYRTGTIARFRVRPRDGGGVEPIVQI